MRAAFWVLLALLIVSCQPPAPGPQEVPPEDWSQLTLSEQPDASYSLAAGEGWERQNAAFYHVWVSAFRDSNADGTGDLDGVTEAIDEGYFSDLGITGLWLSPIFKAASLTAGSSNKHGYDMTDYDAVSPLYGTKQDLRDLLDHAHAKGIRVIFDFVPNHTSSQHPWFTKRDWYVLRGTKPAGWNGFDGFSDWYSYPKGGGGYYYGVFWDGMPDLNYRNRAVRDEMASVVTRWLNFGFDGLRVDAVKYLVEGASPSQWKDQPETLAWFQALREHVLDPYAALGAAKFMVAENWDYDFANLKSYLVSAGRPAFSMTFDFAWPSVVVDFLDGSGSALAKNFLQAYLVTYPSQLPAHTTFGTFQSNHDNVVNRPASSYTGATAAPRLYLAAALSLLGRGTPFVYYGNEIGMTGEAGSDINLRQPFDWDEEAVQVEDADSLWRWHQTLLTLRKDSPAWDDPAIAPLTSPAGVLAWLVTGSGGERAVVVANLKATAVANVTVSGLSGDLSQTRTILGAGQPTVGSHSLGLGSLPAFVIRAYALDEATPSVARDSDIVPSGYAPPSVEYPALYLRGSMNGWDVSAPLVDLGGGEFHSTFAGDGEVLFKVGSDDWAVSLGFGELEYDGTKGGLDSAAFSGADDGFQGLNVRLEADPEVTYDLHVDTSTAPPRFWVLAD